MILLKISIIDYAKKTLTEKFIKQLHFTLKVGTSDSLKQWFKVGDYITRANAIGGNETCPSEKVAEKMKLLIENYNSIENQTIEAIIKFHKDLESIHPFQDGNGSVGRIIMFKECLANNIVPFIIEDELKYYYYRGLKEWENETGFLINTCLAAPDKYKKFLNYFGIKY